MNPLEFGMTTANSSQTHSASSRLTLELRASDRAQAGRTRPSPPPTMPPRPQKPPPPAATLPLIPIAPVAININRLTDRPHRRDRRHRRHRAHVLPAQDRRPRHRVGQRERQRLRLLLARHGVEREQQRHEAHQQRRDERPGQLVVLGQERVGAARSCSGRRTRSRR